MHLSLFIITKIIHGYSNQSILKPWIFWFSGNIHIVFERIFFILLNFKENIYFFLKK